VVRVTIIDAHKHAVDFVSRKTYSSRYCKTAVPWSTTTKHPSSSCRNNPWREWILQQKICNSKS